jgi:hypothetical protein
MRAVVIVVFAVAVAAPADASKSCMTMAEARQQFATSHLYWHGPGHCWDATPPRHRIVARVKPREDQQSPRIDREVNSKEQRWRNAMSEMLPGDGRSETSSAPPSFAVSEPLGVDWLDRWVDVAQVASPIIFDRTQGVEDISPTAGRRFDPVITPMRLILMFIGLGVVLVIIELMFRNFVHDWRS